MSYICNMIIISLFAIETRYCFVFVFFCFLSFSVMLLNIFVPGNTPVLFLNVSCNSSHPSLFQCFDLQNIGIGIHNCQHNEVAGVSCQQILENITATSIILTTTKIISNGVVFTNTTSAINNSTVPSTVTGIATDIKDLIHDVTNLYVCIKHRISSD